MSEEVIACLEGGAEPPWPFPEGGAGGPSPRVGLVGLVVGSCGAATLESV